MLKHCILPSLWLVKACVPFLSAGQEVGKLALEGFNLNFVGDAG
jgi:hypothetical protein